MLCFSYNYYMKDETYTKNVVAIYLKFTFARESWQIELATPRFPFCAAEEDRTLVLEGHTPGRWASGWDVHDPIPGRKEHTWLGGQVHKPSKSHQLGSCKENLLLRAPRNIIFSYIRSFYVSVLYTDSFVNCCNIPLMLVTMSTTVILQ